MPNEEPSEQPSAPRATQPAFARRRRVALIVAVVSLMILAVLLTLLLVGMRAPHSSFQSKSPHSSQLSTSTSQITISDLRPCAQLSDGSPLAQELKKDRQVVVDGRCDSDPSAPVVAYSSTLEDPVNVVAKLETGAHPTALCTAESTVSLRNLAERSSKIWIKIRLGASTSAFVPSIWAQGWNYLAPC